VDLKGNLVKVVRMVVVARVCENDMNHAVEV
jgi:hypothetical protein